MSAQLCHVCLPVWCLLNGMTSAYLCGVSCTVLYDVCLPLHMMSAYVYYVCLPICFLLNCMSSYYEYRTSEQSDISKIHIELANPMSDIKVQSGIGMIRYRTEKLNIGYRDIKSNIDAHL
jgi:hypothetical protein